MKTPALLSVALLLLLVSGVSTTGSNPTYFKIVVENAITPSPDKTYSTFVPFRGILLGGMKRLNESTTANFNFTTKDYLDYGPFLESVNGLVGTNTTYWELLVKKTNGSIITPDVGIGCYIPNANEQIILNYTYIYGSGSERTDFAVRVTNAVTDTPNKTYSTYVAFRGNLLGGLRRLNDSKIGFTFTYTENPNYGPYLQSVNGLAGNSEERTYWELLVKKTKGRIVRPNVGIGCYILNAYDLIILKYTKY